MLMALTGDCILTRRLTTANDPRTVSLIELLTRCGIVFTNLEATIQNLSGCPSAEVDGLHLTTAPFVAKELRRLGVNMVARANNHAGDFGIEGMRETTHHLDDVDIVHAGVGENLQGAREGRFLEARGERVGLLACTMTFPQHSMAGAQHAGMHGRPGVNPMRVHRELTADAVSVELMKGLARRFERSTGGAADVSDIIALPVNSGESSKVDWVLDEKDLVDFADAVRDAAVQCDHTIVSFHSHVAEDHITRTPPVLRRFARAVIDAGASIVVGSGPHCLRGIEFYKGAPIFYCLGNFVFQLETLSQLPGDDYERLNLRHNSRPSEFHSSLALACGGGFVAGVEFWQSVIAILEIDGGRIGGIRLLPITLGRGRPFGRRGSPAIAGEADRLRIAEQLQLLSPSVQFRCEEWDGLFSITLEELEAETPATELARRHRIHADMIRERANE